MGNYIYRSKAKPEMIKMRIDDDCPIREFPTAEVMVPIHPATFAWKDSHRNSQAAIERAMAPTIRAWKKSGREPFMHLYTRHTDDKGKIMHGAFVYLAKQDSAFLDDYNDDFNVSMGPRGAVFIRDGKASFVPMKSMTDDERREAEKCNYGMIISEDLKQMEVANV